MIIQTINRSTEASKITATKFGMNSTQNKYQTVEHNTVY